MKTFYNLFPNKEAFIIFALYIILFVFQGVFVTASKSDDGIYAYNTTLVVSLAEVLKLCASVFLYSFRRDNTKPHIFKAIVINYKLMLLYFIPSLLYCFYNNLAFVNLSHYDPTSYYTLLQFRVVLTALLFQFLFNKKLTCMQWISLGILTLGCILKNFDAAAILTDKGSSSWKDIFNIYFVSINFQNFCSCMAGTYNEYLLKTKGSNVDIFLQNVFMYLDSIICNFFILLFKGEVSTMFNDLRSLGNIFIILIIVNSAVVGIVTSFFLKNHNSILKTYASALELIITAVVCYIIFSIIITWYTILSILLVSIAVLLYFKNPVNNVTRTNGADIKDKKPLLEVVTDK